MAQADDAGAGLQGIHSVRRGYGTGCNLLSRRCWRPLILTLFGDVVSYKSQWHVVSLWFYSSTGSASIYMQYYILYNFPQGSYVWANHLAF